MRETTSHEGGFMETPGEGHNKGQTLVIIAILMVAFIGMLALVLDGGMTYANRRSSQNAADAGALAGARQLCQGANPDEVAASALEYAADRNHASHATILDMTRFTVTVQTDIVYNTFFANILGRPVMTVTTRAIAGCFAPCAAQKILPVSWACEPPISGLAGMNSCSVIAVPEDDPNPPLYIVMDSRKTADLKSGEFCRPPATYCDLNPSDPQCLPGAGVNCDTNNDGFNENISPGDRGWLSLDGSSGNPKGWMTPPNFYDGTPVKPHTWDPVMSGNMDSAYQTAAKYLVGEIVLIPVVDKLCDKGLPIASTCPSKWDPVDQTNPGSGKTYWHIKTFSAFKITCVKDGNKITAIPPATKCTAASIFLNDNKGINANSYSSIEGYFVKNYTPQLSGNCGLCNDVSPCTIYLSQ